MNVAFGKEGEYVSLESVGLIIKEILRILNFIPKAKCGLNKGERG